VYCAVRRENNGLLKLLKAGASLVVVTLFLYLLIVYVYIVGSKSKLRTLGFLKKSDFLCQFKFRRKVLTWNQTNMALLLVNKQEL